MNTPRPQSVTYAVWLMYAGAVLSLAGAVVGLPTARSLASTELSLFHQQLARQPQVALPSLDLMTRMFAVAFIVGGIIDALLWLWMAWKNGQGRSWARVLSTVFFGFLCVGTLSSVTRVNGAEIGSLLLGLVNFAVGLAVIILLYRPDSSQYYQAIKAERIGGYPPVPGAGGYYGYGTPQSTYGYGYPPPPPNPEDPPPPAYPNE